MADPSLVRFRAVVQRALVELEARREEVNDLNVFPVADGDTGDNMALTMRAVLDELDRLSAAGEIDEIGREEIVDSVARAALLGARGNSGVILSQLIRGAAEELASRPGELVDPVLVGAAMARAADRAYDSVREPAEGTILTVVREMAHRVASELAHMGEPRLDQADADAARQDALIADVLEPALEAGEQSVRRGPDLLPILREAGVVDAGGYALTVLVAGVLAALRGTDAPALEHHHAPARVTHPEHESSTYRYCTNFAVTGESLVPHDWVESLEGIGDSVLVVGDQRTLKVHVHTDAPERATALFAGTGTLSRLDVADMHEQVQQRTERLGEPRAVCGVVAVVAGKGMAELFTSLGATPLPGGPTLNPSTYELLAGIHDVRGRGGRGAAQLRQRRDGRRAGRGAVGQEGRGRADAVPAGRPRGRRRARPVPRAPRSTARRCTTRWRLCGPGRSPPRRATTPSRASGAGTPSASSTSGWWRGAARPRRSKPCWASWGARRSCSR